MGDVSLLFGAMLPMILVHPTCRVEWGFRDRPMKVSQIKATGQAEPIPHVEEAVAPWSVPGPEKEAWKERGNYYDYRDLQASRPSDLKITISGPRQFTGL